MRASRAQDSESGGESPRGGDTTRVRGLTFVGTSTDARAGRPSDRRFLVDDVDEAAAELCAAGVPTDDEMSMNARYRYTHFRAPQAVYELVDHVQPPG